MTTSLKRKPKLGLGSLVNKLFDGLWENNMCLKQNSIGIFSRKWKWTFSALKCVQWYKLMFQLRANTCWDHTVNRSNREWTKDHYLHLQADSGNCQVEWVIFRIRAIKFLGID